MVKKIISLETQEYIAKILAEAVEVEISWTNKNGEVGTFSCNPNAPKINLSLTRDGRIVAAGL